MEIWPREKEKFQASHLRSFNRDCNEESHLNSSIWLNGVPLRRFFSVRLVVSRVTISGKCSYSSKAGEKYGARAVRDTNPSKPNVLKTCFSSTAEKGTASHVNPLVFSPSKNPVSLESRQLTGVCVFFIKGLIDCPDQRERAGQSDQRRLEPTNRDAI